MARISKVRIYTLPRGTRTTVNEAAIPPNRTKGRLFPQDVCMRSLARPAKIGMTTPAIAPRLRAKPIRVAEVVVFSSRGGTIATFKDQNMLTPNVAKPRRVICR